MQTLFCHPLFLCPLYCCDFDFFFCFDELDWLSLDAAKKVWSTELKFTVLEIHFRTRQSFSEKLAIKLQPNYYQKSVLLTAVVLLFLPPFHETTNILETVTIKTHLEGQVLVYKMKCSLLTQTLLHRNSQAHTDVHHIQYAKHIYLLTSTSINSLSRLVR